MEKKDRNVMPGDSEIVTKKGFLITPPPKSRNKKPLSSILSGEKAPRENRAEKQASDGAPHTEKTQNRGDRAGHEPNPNRNRPNDRPRREKNGQPNENRASNDANRSANRNGGEKPRSSRPQNGNPNPRENGENTSPERRQNNRPSKGAAAANRGEKKDSPERRPQSGKPPRRNDKGPKPSGSRPKDFAKDSTNGNAKGAAGGGVNGSKKRSEPSGNRPPKQGGKSGRKPSVLSDLGFNPETFFGRKTAEPEKTVVEEEKIDYSKAIPLRDQIYPPKPEKEADVADDENKIEIIGVRFKEAGKIYYFDPDGAAVPYGTPVIVETARGREYGYTAISNRKIPADTVVSPLKKIIRIATNDDRERLLANKEQEKAAESIFIEKAKKLKLDMHLVGVEYTFDNTKLLFYFAAEGRVDFRELVKELASLFRTRIELRQVGVRDEAKILGGLGVCGRPLCCKTFLGEFAQVSIKMAKDQNLSLNSSKISGTCGRLLCCLRYEDEVYQKEYERTPKVDAIVETKDGKGVVTEANPLKGTVKVRLNDKPETPPQTFSRDDVTVVGYAKSANKFQSEEELPPDNE